MRLGVAKCRFALVGSLIGLLRHPKTQIHRDRAKMGIGEIDAEIAGARRKVEND